MKSLFLRFFLSFWLIIGIIIGTAATSGFLYAERMRDAIENFELGDSLLSASAALDSGGHDGLVKWLEESKETEAIRLYVLDDRGHDILRRRVPYGVSRAFWRQRDRSRDHDRDRIDPRNLRRSRPLPQLLAADGRVYTFFVSPSQIPESIWSNADARVLVLIFALLVSGVVSYVLASAISRPVHKLRGATVALANGNLDVRVADSIGQRTDDLGMLGRDFDAMAEKLQRASDQQTELSRNISHELRSPLARMRVAVELARRKAGDLSEFERLDDEAERLDGLIGQILSYTRLDADQEHKPGVVDLADVVSEVVENVNYECRAAGSEGKSVVAELSATPTIQGYAGVLVSAIENVLRNAVRHGPAGSEVGVTLNTDNGHANIEVTDKGTGVDEDDLPRLFEPFFRTRQSAERDANGGTGLGLAIAKRAVELHGGEILARNRNEGGLSIRISLPMGLSK